MVAIRGKQGKTTLMNTFRPVKVATINRDLAVLKRAMNKADEWNYRTKGSKNRNLHGDEGRERVITHDEEFAYLSAAPALLKDFATIAVDTGLRPASELGVLRWEHVHFEPAGNAKFGYLHVPRGKTKNSKRNVPLSARVRTILERRWETDGKPQFGFVMGHSNIQISTRYVHPTPERLETAFAGLDAYNQERRAAVEGKAEQEARKMAETLIQTA
jgi:integrase